MPPRAAIITIFVILFARGPGAARRRPRCPGYNVMILYRGGLKTYGRNGFSNFLQQRMAPAERKLIA